MTSWVVRAGDKAENDELDNWNHGVISIQWNELPDLSKLSKEEITKLGSKSYPRYHPPTATFQIWKFVHEIKIGDWAVMPCLLTEFKPFMAVGEVIGNYQYKEIPPYIIHSRPVKWIKLLPRPSDPDIRKYLRSELTVYRLKHVVEQYIIDTLSEGET